MVFGLFESNKITITTDKQAYAFGEEITGKVVLEIRKPRKAKKICVQLYCEYETTRTVTRTSGTPPRQTTTQETSAERTAVQSLVLDGEKEYGNGRFEYPFKFRTEKTVIAGGFTRNPGWFLDASLDIPMSIDVNRKIRVNLG